MMNASMQKASARSQLPHFSMDCRIKSGNDGVGDRSRDAVAPESLPRASNKTTKRFALRTDLRQRMPAVVTGTPTTCASSHDVRRKKKEAERRRTLIRIRRNFRCGAPFAKGARPSAFHHGSLPLGLFIPRLNLGQAS
jgi:hypothetical protein